MKNDFYTRSRVLVHCALHLLKIHQVQRPRFNYLNDFAMFKIATKMKTFHFCCWHRRMLAIFLPTCQSCFHGRRCVSYKKCTSTILRSNFKIFYEITWQFQQEKSKNFFSCILSVFVTYWKSESTWNMLTISLCVWS